jgi:hypothetical protein
VLGGLAVLFIHVGCLPVDHWPIKTSPQPASKEFDLRADSTDLNGFPLNPAWAKQASAPSGVAVFDACNGDPGRVFKDSTCTSQAVRFDKAKMPTLAVCGLTSSFPGHVNWTPATVTGTASWLAWAAPWDNDVNFYFVPDDEVSGLTAGNEMVAGSDTPYIELEFTSDETLAVFSTSWWVGLWDVVQSWSRSQKTDAEIRAYLKPDPANSRQRAVVVGLFGLDCEHGCKSEVHPVFALALETSRTPNSSTWAIFARNWGTEGFCASRLHYLELPDHALRLSLPGPGPAGQQRLTSAKFVEYATSYPAETPTPLIESDSVDGSAVLTVPLPSPDAHPLSELVVNLVWESASGPHPILLKPRPVRPRMPVQQAGRPSAEHLLRAAASPGRPQAPVPVPVAKTTLKRLEPLPTVGTFSRARKLPVPAQVPAARKPDTRKWLSEREKAQKEMFLRLCDEYKQALPGFTAEQSRRVCASVLK